MVIFRAVMQETHSTIHTLYFVLTLWLIRSFCFRFLACGYNQHIIVLRGSLWRNRDGAAMPLDTEKVGIKDTRRFSHHYFLFRRIFRKRRLVARLGFYRTQRSFRSCDRYADLRRGRTGAKDGLLRWSWHRRLSFLGIIAIRMDWAVCGRRSN